MLEILKALGFYGISIILVVAYIIIIQALYKAQNSTYPDMSGLKMKILIGLSAMYTSIKSLDAGGENQDADIEYSMVYHTSKWFRRFGYDSKLKRVITDDDEEETGVQYDIDGNTPPRWVRCFSTILALFRVIFYPFTGEDRW